MFLSYLGKRHPKLGDVLHQVDAVSPALIPKLKENLYHLRLCVASRGLTFIDLMTGVEWQQEICNRKELPALPSTSAQEELQTTTGRGVAHGSEEEETVTFNIEPESDEELFTPVQSPVKIEDPKPEKSVSFKTPEAGKQFLSKKFQRKGEHL